jgi:hypothetical protein
MGTLHDVLLDVGLKLWCRVNDVKAIEAKNRISL